MDTQAALHWLITLARFEEEREQLENHIQRSRKKRQDLIEVEKEYEGDLGAVLVEVDRLAQEVRAQERAVQDLQAKVAHKQSQQLQIKDNKQYQIMNQEIEALREQIDGRETAILEAIDQMEKQQESGQSLAEEAAREREKIARRRDRLAETLQEAEDRLPDLDREIAACEKQLHPELVANLKRLRSGLSLPVVWLAGEACGGCHAQFPTQIAMAIDASRDIVRCQSCGRFVVPKG